MKLFITISLSLLILVQPLSKMLLVLHYQVNRGYIAAVLCENKAKPQLHCEGKCQLKKELKAAATHEAKLPQLLKAQHEILYFHQLPFFPVFQRIFVSFQIPVRTYKAVAYASPDFSIFHPPQV
ncbi:hypothetical protein [Adhaeribacter soli]|uniref:Uncharacterized protein n=1 Tax=Adhaeribacter soli TaxID=2607655 RepID=A0A5N1IK87_9BACT|nr:hypothetical protein [Adhaeribacter soli]KAA9325689.1 hypothetical protein F0P94_17295 [Adhaeribacter soli]